MLMFIDGVMKEKEGKLSAQVHIARWRQAPRAREESLA